MNILQKAKTIIKKIGHSMNYNILQLNQKYLKRHVINDSIIMTFIKGKGIEIGALHNPLNVFSNTKVKYIDRMNNEDLRKQYPELKHLHLVNVDIIDDGESLATVQDSSQDFVIANHFIEHCQNPIGAIENFLRVSKDDGIVYLTVPNMDFTFDGDRNPTSFEHLLEDYKNSKFRDKNKISHFNEYIREVDKITENTEFKKRLDYLISINYSIHFHVWNYESFLHFLLKIKQELNFNFSIELYTKDKGSEDVYGIIAVLKKI